MTERQPPGLPPLKPPRKSKRGFAALSPERRREIAAMGGAAVPPHLRSFSIYPGLAAEAGTKGGKRAHALGKAHRWLSRSEARAQAARARRIDGPSRDKP